MPSLRLEYQLSPNAPAQDGTRAVRLRIYAGQPPAFITVTRCAPADFIPARKGRPAEVRNNRPATNVMRVMKSRAEQIYSDMILAGEHITSAAIKARLEGAPSQDFLALALLPGPAFPMPKNGNESYIKKLCTACLGTGKAR